MPTPSFPSISAQWEEFKTTILQKINEAGVISIYDQIEKVLADIQETLAQHPSPQFDKKIDSKLDTFKQELISATSELMSIEKTRKGPHAESADFGILANREKKAQERLQNTIKGFNDELVGLFADFCNGNYSDNNSADLPSPSVRLFPR